MEIYTENLVALCHIIDEYPQFREDLKLILNKKNIYKSICTLAKVSHREIIMGKKAEKKVYTNNKEIIEKINTDSNVWDFVNDIKAVDYYYDYLNAHKKDLNTILTVINKIHELGIRTITLNPNKDFTKEIYKIDNCGYAYLNFFAFVDNLKIIPAHQTQEIKYVTSNSPYKIDINLLHECSEITLNTLIFNADTLPKELNYEETLNKINDLNALVTKENNQVTNSVNLQVGIDDLEKWIEQMEHDFNKDNMLDEKIQIQKSLLNIKKSLLELKQASDNYLEKITKDNKQITPDLIKNEKDEYVRRRSINN